VNDPLLTEEVLGRVIVFDTETGGLDPFIHSLLSIGLVSYDGTRRTEIFVCEPDIGFHPRSMQVNGIDLDWIREHGVSPREAVAQVEAFLAETAPERPDPPAMMVGHNVAFDLSYMRRIYSLAGQPFPREFSHRSIDTHTILWSLAVRGALPFDATSSDGAFKWFQIEPPPEARHTALGDAIATRDLLEQLLPLIAE
jgi:DNA polymerase III subunit epsilon